MNRGNIGFIVAAHGNMAASMVRVAEDMLGQKIGMTSFEFLAEEKFDVSLARLRKLIQRQNQGRGVIVLADLFGGTPGTMAFSMLETGSLEVVTGVNLPMVIAAAEIKADMDLADAAQKIKQAGKSAIKQAGELLGN